MNYDLDHLKKSVSLLQYIKQNVTGETLSIGPDTWRINPCPICGHKDHFTVYENTNSFSSFSKCCAGGSIIDFFIQFEGLDEKAAIEKLKNLAGGKKFEPVQNVTTELHRDETPSKIDYTQYSKDNTPAKVYLAKRGISSEIIEAYNEQIFYNEQMNNLVIKLDDFSSFNRGISHESTFKGNTGPAKLFNERYLTDNIIKTIYICEGIFDALSIETMGEKAISINSTSNIKSLLAKIKENNAYKTKFYVSCLDNDKGGKKATIELTEGLKNLNADHTIFTLPEGIKDINEFLTKDKNYLNELLNNKIFSEPDCDYNFLDSWLNDRRFEPIKTCFENLNAELGAEGLIPGLYVFGAASSCGKTTLALQIGTELARANNKVMFFSLEQSRGELMSRSLSRLTYEKDSKNALTAQQICRNKGLTSKQVTNFGIAYQTYKEKIARNFSTIEGNFDLTLEKIIAKVTRYIELNQVKPIIFIDYLQTVRTENKDILRKDERKQVDYIVTTLKQFSRNNGLILFVISSFSRGFYSKDISMDAFKESGGIEYTGDIVAGLQYERINEKGTNLDDLKRAVPREISFQCVKDRFGVGAFKLSFDYYSMYNHFEPVNRSNF